MEQQTIERKFDVQGQARLSLSNISGSVDIQPGDDGVIVVTAVKDTSRGDTERTQIDMEQAGDGAVFVETKFGENGWRWFGGRPCDVAYTVRVPRNCALRLRCVSSSSAVRGLSGSSEIANVSGDLDLSSLSGALKLNCVSGSLIGEQLAGPLEVETVSGGVDLRACDAGSVRVSTVSGRVSIETPLGNGPYKFHSVSGNVRLIVQPEARGSVHATSLSGRVTSDLPVTRSQRSGQNWQLELQGGGPEIRFDSISGNLSIERGSGSGPVAVAQAAPSFAVAEGVPVPPEPPAPPSPIETAEQTRRDILDRVARGEISVDEAVKVLRG
jgi:hypothetical protein